MAQAVLHMNACCHSAGEVVRDIGRIQVACPLS